MKRSEELLGLSVISIEDGTEVGRVSDLVINPVKGTVEYLVIDNGLKYLGIKILPFERVGGVGEYAVTIQTAAAIIDLNEQPEINDLLEKNIRVKGTKVLTIKGKLFGTVNEFIVDEDNEGKIAGCEVIPVRDPDNTGVIAADIIITFGKDVLIVNEEVELVDAESLGVKKNEFIGTDLTENIEEIPVVIEETTTVVADEVVEIEQAVDEEVTAEAVQEIAEEVVVETVEETVEEVIETPVEEIIEETVAVSAEVIVDEIAEAPKKEKQSGPSEAAKLFEARQRQYLTGRKVSKRIESELGEVIAEEGNIITEELLDKAKAAGKFPELSMNTRA
jgi:uncharacterized protein YrrD